MDDFDGAMSALGIAAPPSAPSSRNLAVDARPAPGARAYANNGYANEAQMRQTASGDMGADPQSAIREINATQKQLASAPNLDPASRKLLQDHIGEMQRQLSNIPDSPKATQAAAPDTSDFDGAMALLQGSPASAPSAAQPTPSQIEQQAASQPRLIRKGDPIDPHAPISSPEADLTMNQVSGLASTVAGGIGGIGTGLYKLAQTGNLDQAIDAASNTVRNIQQAGTYQPRTEEGAKMVEQFGSNYNPLNWIPKALQYAGDTSGEAVADAGYPATGALLKGAGEAAPLALGLGAKGLLKGAPEAMPPRVEPTMTPLSAMADKPRYKLVDGKPVLIEQGAEPQTITPTGAPAGQGPAAVPVSAPAPAPKPTLAAATPELQQAVATAQAKGISVAPDVLARHVEADTLPVPVKMTTGQAAADVNLISNEMNSRGKGQSAPVSPDFYNAQAKALAKNLDVTRAKLAPDVPDNLHPAQMGQSLVDEYKAMDAPVRADISGKYKALEQANGGQFPLNGKDFVSAADQALEAKNKTRYLPAEVAGDLADLRNGGPMTFNNFENLRTTLAAAGRKADRAGDGNASHAISLVRNSLESLPMTGETAAIKPLADAARSAAKARFDALDADPAYKAAAGDSVKAGEPSPLAEKFVQSYIVNGKGAYVKNMKANLAGSDTAGQLISAAGMDYLKGMAQSDAKTGVFGSANYNKGLKQLGPKAADIFGPEGAQTVQQVGNVAKYTSVAPRGSFVNSSNSATALGSPAMQSAISKAKAAAELGTNFAFHGVPVGSVARWGGGLVGDLRANKAAAAESKASTEPLAGFKKLSDIGK